MTQPFVITPPAPMSGRSQFFVRRAAQSVTASPLLMSACTSPSIIKVGDT